MVNPRDRFCTECLNHGKAGGCPICLIDTNKDPELHAQFEREIPEEHPPLDSDDPWEGIDIDLWRKDRGEYMRRVEEAKKKENRRFA